MSTADDSGTFCRRHSYLEKKVDRLYDQLNALHRKMILWAAIAAFLGGVAGDQSRNLFSVLSSAFKPAQSAVAQEVNLDD